MGSAWVGLWNYLNYNFCLCSQGGVIEPDLLSCLLAPHIAVLKGHVCTVQPDNSKLLIQVRAPTDGSAVIHYH